MQVQVESNECNPGAMMFAASPAATCSLEWDTADSHAVIDSQGQSLTAVTVVEMEVQYPKVV